jgi:hypothetical protein
LDFKCGMQVVRVRIFLKDSATLLEHVRRG